MILMVKYNHTRLPLGRLLGWLFNAFSGCFLLSAAAARANACCVIARSLALNRRLLSFLRRAVLRLLVVLPKVVRRPHLNALLLGVLDCLGSNARAANQDVRRTRNRGLQLDTKLGHRQRRGKVALMATEASAFEDHDLADEAHEERELAAPSSALSRRSRRTVVHIHTRSSEVDRRDPRSIRRRPSRCDNARSDPRPRGRAAGPRHRREVAPPRL